jgi:hypothetical protein
MTFKQFHEILQPFRAVRLLIVVYLCNSYLT